MVEDISSGLGASPVLLAIDPFSFEHTEAALSCSVVGTGAYGAPAADQIVTAQEPLAFIARKQFTSSSFIQVLQKNHIQISMDGRGAWRDNVFVERLWKLVKYEEGYLHAYDSVSEAKAGVGR